jgi:hypothetical protein
MERCDSGNAETEQTGGMASDEASRTALATGLTSE